MSMVAAASRHCQLKFLEQPESKICKTNNLNKNNRLNLSWVLSNSTKCHASFTQNHDFFTETDSFRSLTFWERLKLAWQVVFNPPKHNKASNAEIAKQRLKMILISDRCSVNEQAKKKIVANIVRALSDFVEIESEEKVQLNVITDPQLGTIYSVTVPVRRVKPEYQEYSKELHNVQVSEGLTCDVVLEYPPE